MNSRYQVQHLSLAIEDPRGIAADAAHRFLGAFRQEPHARRQRSAPSLTRLSVGDDPRQACHVEPLPLVWHGRIDEISLVVSRRGSRRRVVVPQVAVLDYDIEGRWAALDIEGPRCEGAVALLVQRLICDCLARSGHAFLHAACLAMPRPGGWGGVVLSAPSNTGKTTTALALAASGWRLLGDDIAYVQPPHLGSHVWGFPRACHVRPGAFAMLPWLATLDMAPAGAEGVRTLPLERLGARAWTDAPWLPPALVVVLEKPNCKGARVEPIDRATALSRLGGESIDATPEPANGEAARHLTSIGRLVCETPLCRLSVGPDPTEAAEALERFVAVRSSARQSFPPQVLRRAA